MRNRLRNHIETVFSYAENNTKVNELKEEILQNITEKYDDEIASGKSEEEAYHAAITSIGDVSGLIGELSNERKQPPTDNSSNYQNYQSYQSYQNNISEVSYGELKRVKRRCGLLKAVAVGLYISCFTPCILFYGNTVADTLSPIFMFVIIAIATGIIIYADSCFKPYRKAKVMRLTREEAEDINRCKRASSIRLSIAVIMYILCVVPPIFGEFFGGWIAEGFTPSVMFWMISVATGLIVYGSSSKIKPAKNAVIVDGPGESYTSDAPLSAGKGSVVLPIAVAAVIIAVGAFMIGLGIFTDGFISVSGDRFYDDGSYEIGSATVTGEIEKIEISWISGDIEMTDNGNAGEVSFYEQDKNGEITDSDRKLRYKYDASDKSLTIKARKSIRFFNFGNELDKSLNVELPKGINLKDVDIDTVSGEVKINGINSQSLNIDGVSAELVVKDANIDEVEVDTTSGKVDVEGNIKRFEADSVSGSVELKSGIELEAFSADTVSGEVELKIQNKDFEINFDTVSGDLQSDLSFKAESDDRYIFGNGGREFEVDTVSGSLKVKVEND